MHLQNDLTLKKNLVVYISNLIQVRIAEIKSEIDDANDSKKNESKSSAGDKYETSREMIQQTLNNLESQLKKYDQLLQACNQINFNKCYSKIENGCLVKTNEHIFLIGIPLGKIEFENIGYYAISLDSPIGNALKNKKEKESINFLNKTIDVLMIV